MQAWAAAVVARYGHVDVLFNNAGMILPTKPIEELSPAELRRIVDVNLWGPVYGSLAFLPHLKQRPAANLVTVASIAGEIAFAEQVAYCMSKFAVRGFTEGLRMELLGTNVSVTVVVPGTVLTDIVRNSPGFSSDDAAAAQRSMARLPLKTQPAHAAARIIQAVERKRPRVVIGKDAALLDIVARLFPGQYSRLLGPLAARVSSAARPASDPKGSGKTSTLFH
jgi:NAD(P)-dependent dehydrogenase (short-subunit alcohol dehydrogenase family)